MIVNNDADLDLALNFRVDDFHYVVFVTTDKIKCFGCGTVGHLVRACPSKQGESGRAAYAKRAANDGEQSAKETAEVESAVARVSDHDGAHGAGTAENAAVSVEEEI